MIRIHPPRSIADFLTIEELQLRVWRFSEREVTPRNELITIQRDGGIVLGAYDGKKMIGFVFGFVGWDRRKPFHSSRMLAVLPVYRDGGIGRKLKLAQRRAALAQGITEMRWTFDPLQSKNAYFNIAVLGGTARDYRNDVYGPSTSTFNRGLPTDRLILRWDLNRPSGKRIPPADAARMNTVSIPFDVNALRKRNLRSVLSERVRVRGELVRAFRAGWEVTGFSSDGRTESRYVLTKRRER